MLFWNRCVWNRLVMSMSNENRTTAFVEGETLIYQRDGEYYQLCVGTSAWYAWLQTATSFRVRSPFGTFTVRREQAGNQRGNRYWRAYRKPRADSTVSMWARRRSYARMAQHHRRNPGRTGHTHRR